MTEEQIEAVLGQRLRSMPGVLPILWENQTADLPLPYLTAQLVPVARTDATVAGGGVTSRGFWFITVVSPLDGFATAARLQCSAIIARYPFGLRLPGSGGVVLIAKPADAQAGLSDGAHWRSSVRVDYQAFPA